MTTVTKTQTDREQVEWLQPRLARRNRQLGQAADLFDLLDTALEAGADVDTLADLIHRGQHITRGEDIAAEEDSA